MRCSDPLHNADRLVRRPREVLTACELPLCCGAWRSGLRGVTLVPVCLAFVRCLVEGCSSDGSNAFWVPLSPSSLHGAPGITSLFISHSSLLIRVVRSVGYCDALPRSGTLGWPLTSYVFIQAPFLAPRRCIAASISSPTVLLLCGKRLIPFVAALVSVSASLLFGSAGALSAFCWVSLNDGARGSSSISGELRRAPLVPELASLLASCQITQQLFLCPG